MPVISIPIERIKADPEQPRKVFNRERIKNLSRSIAEVGLLQPILVRPAGDGENYYLVAGERRLQGSINAGEENIMATVLEDSDVSIRQLQLVENLQREDLNPLEKARSISEYMEEEGLNKSKVSLKLGIARTTVTEWLNILDVSPRYQEEVVKNFEDNSSPLTLSHISLAKALDQKTGDPTKKEEFLDAVLAHELSREEARRVVHLFDTYYNITVDEAVAAVRLYSSSDLLKKRKDRLGRDREKESLSPEMEEFLDVLEILIKKVDKLLGSQKERDALLSTPLLERLLILHCLVERFMKGSMGIPLEREDDSR